MIDSNPHHRDGSTLVTTATAGDEAAFDVAHLLDAFGLPETLT